MNLDQVTYRGMVEPNLKTTTTFDKWTTSNFLKLEEDPNSLEIEEDLNFFEKWKMTLNFKVNGTPRKF